MNKEAFDKENIFGIGQPNTGFAQYFVGESYLNPLLDPTKSSLFLANVTFEPGCRNNWHIHHAKRGGGQMPALDFVMRLADRAGATAKDLMWLDGDNAGEDILDMLGSVLRPVAHLRSAVENYGVKEDRRRIRARRKAE